MEHAATHALAQQLEQGTEKSFALAGNAVLTLRSRKTGQRYTYRIRKHDTKDLWFVALLEGPDNVTDYKYLGVIEHDGYRVTQKSYQPQAPSQKAFRYFWDFAGNDCTVPACLEVWHAGRCGRCARRLTVPESIASGFGPECLGKI